MLSHTDFLLLTSGVYLLVAAIKSTKKIIRINGMINAKPHNTRAITQFLYACLKSTSAVLIAPYRTC